MTHWNALLTVFRKEIVDNARDRRSLLVAFIYPLMGPLLIGLLASAVGGVMKGSESKISSLPVLGLEYAPRFGSYLKDQGIEPVLPPPDAEDAVRRGRTGAVVVLSPEFETSFAAGETAPVKVIVNTARLPGMVALNRVADVLAGFNSEVWSQRLAARGIDHRIFRPIAIETVNVAARGNAWDVLLLMIPPLFIFNVFMGGVYVTIDITSGERERDSLEPLLINPVERWVLVLGKFGAALFFTAAAVAVQLLAFKGIFQGGSGIAAEFGRMLTLPRLGAVFVMAIPLMMCAVGVQFVIATVTRSFKEAQTYLGLLPLVPALPGMLIVFAPVAVQNWMMAVPAFSQTLLMGQVVRGEPLDMLQVMLSMLATGICAALLMLASARLFDREKLVFGG